MVMALRGMCSFCSVTEFANKSGTVDLIVAHSASDGYPNPETDPNSKENSDVETSLPNSEGTLDVEDSPPKFFESPSQKGVPHAEASPPKFFGPPKLLGDDWFTDKQPEIMGEDSFIAPITTSNHVSHHEFHHNSHTDRSDYSDREGLSSVSTRSSSSYGSSWNRRHSGSTRKHEEIPTDALGPPLNAMDDNLPDWRWEVRNDKWSSYARHDAMKLERYWQYYAKSQGEGLKRPHVARLQVAGKEAIVDFQTLTIQVNGGKVRPLVRRQLPDNWLSNSWFFGIFINSLGNQANRLGAELENLFDTRFNEDFRDINVTSPMSPPCVWIAAAGRVYKPPFGWKRFAANVHGKYTESLQWFRENGAGAWAVAYHGLRKDNLPEILFTGFAGLTSNEVHEAEASNFSCTPLLEVAAQDADTTLCDDHNIQMVLQLRVRPTAVQKETRTKPYWLITNPDDVRIYGVLVREVPSSRAGLDKKVTHTSGKSTTPGSIARN